MGESQGVINEGGLFGPMQPQLNTSATDRAYQELFDRSVEQAFKLRRDYDLAKDLAVAAVDPIYDEILANPALLEDPEELERRRSWRVQTCFFNWKRSQRATRDRERQYATDLDAPSFEPDLEMADPETRLDAALRRLPKDERDVWVLRRIKKVPTHEIAIRMRTSVETIRKRLTRASHKLSQDNDPDKERT